MARSCRRRRSASRCPQAAQKAAPEGHSLPQASQLATVAPSFQAHPPGLPEQRRGGRAERLVPDLCRPVALPLGAGQCQGSSRRRRAGTLPRALLRATQGLRHVALGLRAHPRLRLAAGSPGGGRQSHGGVEPRHVLPCLHRPHRDGAPSPRGRRRALEEASHTSHRRLRPAGTARGHPAAPRRECCSARDQDAHLCVRLTQAGNKRLACHLEQGYGRRRRRRADLHHRRAPKYWKWYTPDTVRHELAHVYADDFGDGRHFVGLLVEGLAVAVEGGYDFSALRAEVASGNRVLPLKKALRHGSVWKGLSDRQIDLAYLEGGALVRYLRKRWGMMGAWAFADAVAASDMTPADIEEATGRSSSESRGADCTGYGSGSSGRCPERPPPRRLRRRRSRGRRPPPGPAAPLPAIACAGGHERHDLHQRATRLRSHLRRRAPTHASTTPATRASRPPGRIVSATRSPPRSCSPHPGCTADEIAADRRCEVGACGRGTC